MGGRGSSSGMKGSGGSSKISGLDVTSKNGETTRYYFTSKNGVNYYQRGLSGMPEPTPSNMPAKEFKKRVESNGATTRTVSSKEQHKEQKQYKAGRKSADKLLDQQWYKAAGRPRKGMKGH